MELIQKHKHFILLHFIVVLFGLTGILGKLINLDSFSLVWIRVGVAIIGIYAYLLFTKKSIKINPSELPGLAFAGVIIAFHWITFFEAIKVSNVSVALACFSSTTLFASILEPIYNKRKIVIYELVLGLIIIGAILLIFKIDFSFKKGILLSLLSAFLASWFTVLNGKYIRKTNPELISFYELSTAFLILTVIVLIYGKLETFITLSSLQLFYLLTLGLLCTSFAYVVSVSVMKYFSAYTVTITVNLEPIYSIILALIIWPLEERMPPLFYVSFGIIIICLFLNAYFKRKYTPLPT